MRKPITFAILFVAFAGSPLLACSAKKPNPPITVTAIVDAGPEAGEASTPIIGTADSGAGEAGPLLVATGDAGPIAPINFAEAMDPAIDLAIRAAAAGAAPGMTAEGNPGRATLAENEHFNMIVTLQPNHCYTIIGFSPLGQVASLNVQLMGPPFYNVSAGGSGANDKNTPVMGRGKAALCPIVPIPVAYKIDVQAKKGAGRMAVQLFSKNK